jgi:dTMP kinase
MIAVLADSWQRGHEAVTGGPRVVLARVGSCPGESQAGQAAIGARAVPGRAGFLVTIDGPAGVGKTTVTALAGAWLVALGVPAVVTGQPSGSAMGRLARASTHDLRGLPLSFLMAADRYHHQDHVITPALKAGQVVLCDRYVTTALVLDQLDGADPEFIWGIYQYLRWPDLAVILTGDPAVCRARAAGRGLYSRFHEGGAAAAKTEAALYDRSAELLSGYGYAIEILSIGDRTAEQVAGMMLGLIQDRMTAARAQQ